MKNLRKKRVACLFVAYLPCAFVAFLMATYPNVDQVASDARLKYMALPTPFVGKQFNQIANMIVDRTITAYEFAEWLDMLGGAAKFYVSANDKRELSNPGGPSFLWFAQTVLFDGFAVVLSLFTTCFMVAAHIVIVGTDEDEDGAIEA